MKVDFRKLNEDLPKEVQRFYIDGIRTAVQAGQLTPEGVDIICDTFEAHLNALQKRAGVVTD
ncbi:hypothetical protein ACF09J_15600 [Streptomyces sp. NPDC014889]|uniref:hypothetical protein n=1 Tax=Streptomyces sp. NPDC014889 TaxID=3364928 RepID=UPI0036FC2BEC